MDTDAWYSDYVSAAYSNGIISGISESKFGVGSEISRADMAVICMRIINMKNIEISCNENEINFSDGSDIPEYAQESVEKLVKGNLIHGVSSDRFAPRKPTTRAMAAKLIYDILKISQGAQQ